MASIKGNKITFQAVWNGKGDKKTNVCLFHFDASASEQGSLLYLWSLTNKTPLSMTIHTIDEKIFIGECVFFQLNGKGEGDGIISFKARLEDWKLLPSQQVTFKETLLTVV